MAVFVIGDLSRAASLSAARAHNHRTKVPLGATAQASLEAAVAELDRLPALDARSIALAAHALNNFLTVSGAVVELLIPVLRGHPHPQVRPPSCS
jgi:hypothetical protein